MKYSLKIVTVTMSNLFLKGKIIQSNSLKCENTKFIFLTHNIMPIEWSYNVCGIESKKQF